MSRAPLSLWAMLLHWVAIVLATAARAVSDHAANIDRQVRLDRLAGRDHERSVDDGP